MGCIGRSRQTARPGVRTDDLRGSQHHQRSEAAWLEGERGTSTLHYKAIQSLIDYMIMQ